jgi:hypothetical protein
MFFGHAQMREQRVGLEHHVHGPLIRRDLRQILARPAGCALDVGVLEPGQHAHQRGLAAARGAEQRKELAA